MKLTKKNYDMLLENILEKKDFSEDSKNLLLRMLYKIEDLYKDYAFVKRFVKTKEAFVSDLLFTIEHECNNITVLKYEEQEKIEEQSKTDNTNRTIVLYDNERLMLKNLAYLSQSHVIDCQDYGIIERVFLDLLKEGESISYEEILRTFTGYSWDNKDDTLKNKNDNIIYQSLVILVGIDFIDLWKKNSITYFLEQLKTKLKERYSEYGIRMYEMLLSLLKNIGLEGNGEESNLYLEQFLKCFFRCFRMLIQKAKTKKQLVDLIYILRYFVNITKQNEETGSEYLENIEYILIKRAEADKIIKTFSEDKKINAVIISKIFYTGIIELEKIRLQLTRINGILTIEVYEDHVLDSIYKVEEEEIDKTIRLYRKEKVFL